MRQDLVPWISFYAELEVAVPDLARDAFLNKRGWHMVVEFLAADQVDQVTSARSRCDLPAAELACYVIQSERRSPGNAQYAEVISRCREEIHRWQESANDKLKI